MTIRRSRAATAFLLALVTSACALGPPATSPATATPGTTAAPAPTSEARPSPPAVGGGPERIRPAPLARPAQPSLAARYEANLVDDPCVDRDLPAPPASDPALTVLDRSYALPASYAPGDLVPAAEAGLTGPSGAKLVRSALVADLADMVAAWEAAGLTLAIDSAYRSYAAQAATFETWVARVGHEQALLRSARPGHSEHQLGTALDLSSPGWSGRFGDWAGETREGAWMAEHAWEYGFVMSYPAGAQAETCFGYEPWHYRWIGREAAAEQRESGQVLREYLERHVRG